MIELAVISIGLNSCCTEKHCIGADDQQEVFLMNFSSAEVDSIFVVSYKKHSDFKTVVDSFMVERCDSIGNHKFDLDLNVKRINIDFDYRIYLTMINRAYKITGFKTSKAECNGCSPSFIKDYFTRLEGYEINGKFKYLGFIQIDKDND